MFKSLLPIIIATIFLTACGGGGSSTGGGGNVIPPSVNPTPNSFPNASGNPVAFFAGMAYAPVKAGSMLASKPGANIIYSATPTPSPTSSASPAPTPSPTPTPFPTLPPVSGNPFISTSIVSGDGVNVRSGGTVYMQVVNAHASPLPEAVAPTIMVSNPNDLTFGNEKVSTLSSFPNAYQADIYTILPQHLKLAAEFPDATGIVDVYGYDEFYVSCSQFSSMSVTSGSAAVQPLGDVTVTNCAGGGTLNFTNGYMVISSPQADVFGQIDTALTSVLQAQSFVSKGTSLDSAQAISLEGYIIQAPDVLGTQHKYMLLHVDQTGIQNDVTMLQLSANSTGAFPY